MKQRPHWLVLFKAITLGVWVAIFAVGTILLRVHHIPLKSFPHVLHQEVMFLGPWAPAVILLAYLISAIIPLPTSAFAVALGSVYGSVWGGVIAWCGLNASANLSFFLARTFGQTLIIDLEQVSPWIKASDDAFTQKGFFSILVMRCLSFPFEVVSLFAGLSRMSWKSFASATAFGSIPAVIALVLLANTKHLLRDGVILLIAVLCIVAVGAMWQKWLQEKK